jgi:glycosyltransferase involved in cell wall biosynthesis
MKITVAICTWNRAALLAQTLECMTALRVPAEVEWELLVVNNNCTDETDEVLARYTGRLPLRRCWEPNAGLSNARNRAVAEAAGEYLIWTDDDVVVNEEWLATYHQSFRRFPEAAVFGGPIVPRFAGQPPSWLVRAFPLVASAYGAIDLGTTPRELDCDHLPFGANMAVRMREQRRHLFDPTLGVRPGRRLVGEETEVMQAILKGGGSGRWVPDARIGHRVPAHYQTVAYLRKHFFAWGRFCARDLAPGTGKRWLGRPRWLWRHALERELCYRVRRVIGQPAAWVEDLVRASIAWGRLHDAKTA